MARAIDLHFDEMLYDGMPIEQLLWVEDQRQQAHDQMMNRVLQPGGYRRV